MNPTPKRWIVRTPRGIWSREPIRRLAEAAARDAARAHGSAVVERSPANLLDSEGSDPFGDNEDAAGDY